MNWDSLKPNYTVVIDTPAKARLYNRILIVKIAVQLFLIGLILALAWGEWKGILLGLAIGVALILKSKFKRK